MASTSRYGGPSLTPEESADPSPPSRPERVRVHRAELGFVDQPRPDVPKEVESFPGDNSSASTPKQQTSDDKPKAAPRKRARTTENHSSPIAKEPDSSVHSMDGDGPNNETPPSDEDLFDDI